MNIKEFIYMNERIYTIGHIRESNASIQHHQKRAQTFRFKFSTKKKKTSVIRILNGKVTFSIENTIGSV